MKQEHIKQICLEELLFNESFLTNYYTELIALKNDSTFLNIIRSILKEIPLSVIFPKNQNVPEHIWFKKQHLRDVFVSEKLGERFPAYQHIYNAVRAQGNTGLSAVISIFYGVVYLLTDEYPQNSVSPMSTIVNDESDFDYRKKWPAKYRCDDGHYVRSKNEQLVDNWLYHHQICHAYEVLVVDRKNNVEYISDFYLPHLNTYMEVWGFESPE